MKHGEHADRLETQCIKQKIPKPKWLEERPQLGLGLLFYYESYHKLSTERMPADYVTAIPWSKIQQYAEHYGMGFEEQETFHFFINKLDNAYMTKVAEDVKKQNKSSDFKKQNQNKS